MTSHRDAILARRARFIAAALAGVGIGACSGESSPQVCLAPIGDSGVLSDASADGHADASAGASGSAGSAGIDSGGAAGAAAQGGSAGSSDAAAGD
jgi:hypothetical protein